MTCLQDPRASLHPEVHLYQRDILDLQVRIQVLDQDLQVTLLASLLLDLRDLTVTLPDLRYQDLLEVAHMTHILDPGFPQPPMELAQPMASTDRQENQITHSTLVRTTSYSQSLSPTTPRRPAEFPVNVVKLTR